MTVNGRGAPTPKQAWVQQVLLEFVWFTAADCGELPGTERIRRPETGISPDVNYIGYGVARELDWLQGLKSQRQTISIAAARVARSHKLESITPALNAARNEPPIPPTMTTASV
jgi:hypothetical protein